MDILIVAHWRNYLAEFRERRIDSKKEIKQTPKGTCETIVGGRFAHDVQDSFISAQPKKQTNKLKLKRSPREK